MSRQCNGPTTRSSLPLDRPSQILKPTAGSILPAKVGIHRLKFTSLVTYQFTGNNMYVFPGIGLGTVLCEAVHVTQEMIYASAVGLAESLTDEEREKGWLYPNLDRIRSISVIVARSVIRAAQKENLDKNKTLQWLNDMELDNYIRSKMYNPAGDHSGSSSPTLEVNGQPAKLSNL